MLEHLQMLRKTVRSPASYLATRDETNRSTMGGCGKYLPKPLASCLKSVSLPPICGINMRASASSLSITRGENNLASRPGNGAVCVLTTVIMQFRELLIQMSQQLFFNLFAVEC